MEPKIRSSVIAGTWYPGNKNQLENMIQTFFKQAHKKQSDGNIMGLISPHAGYIYSGQIAAYGYKQLCGYTFDTIVIISPLHQMYVGDYMINTADFYETPLGKIPVSRDDVQLLKNKIDISFITADGEHALEIQLPFLQIALKDFSILPIMVGKYDVFSCEDIINALADIFKDRKTLFIASTDLHHIPNYEQVVERDKKVVDTLAKFALPEVRDILSGPDCSVCGKVPISIVLDVTQKLGANTLKILKYSNSGDVTGNRQDGQYTVGYVSAAIFKA